MARNVAVHDPVVPAFPGGLRVLVTGGRHYADRANVFAKLDAQHARRGVAVVIHGGATGADALAEEWAQARGVVSVRYLAQWHVHGRAAGPIRNQRMLDEGAPDFVLHFPGGRGTADMVSRALAAGLPVLNCGPAPTPTRVTEAP